VNGKFKPRLIYSRGKILRCSFGRRLSGRRNDLEVEEKREERGEREEKRERREESFS
jgi:hypothetical protein